MKLQYQVPMVRMDLLNDEDILTLSVGVATPKIGEERNVIDFEGTA